MTLRLLILLCLLVPVAARAAPASPSGQLVMGSDEKPWNRGVSLATREAARTVFLEGNRLFRVPLFARAAEQYKTALQQWKHPAFYFNLAIAQLNLGQDVEAHDSLERAIRQGAEPLGDEQYAEAKKQLAEVERQLGRLRITCDTPGAEVTLDGAALFVGPGVYQGWATAQPHELTAKRDGYISEAKRVAIAHGETRQVSLDLVTLSEATDRSRRWATWKPWAVVGTGAAVMAAGGVVHALAARNFNDYDEKFAKLPCAAMRDMVPAGCSREQIGAALDQQLDRANRQQRIAIGAYIGGGALVAAGAVLLYFNRPRLVEQASSHGISLEPSISRGMVGLAVSVTR